MDTRYNSAIVSEILSKYTYCTHFNPSTVPLQARDKYKDYKFFDSDADLKIAFAHWGGQYSPEPEKEQINIGNYLNDKGYNIIGSGPHTPHQVEIQNDKMIAYSLGDFLSKHQKPGTTNKGIILNITFENNKVISYKETPIHTETINGSSIIKIS